MPAITITPYNPDPDSPAHLRIDNEGAGAGSCILDFANGSDSNYWRIEVPNGTSGTCQPLSVRFGDNAPVITFGNGQGEDELEGVFIEKLTTGTFTFDIDVPEAAIGTLTSDIVRVRSIEGTFITAANVDAQSLQTSSFTFTNEPASNGTGAALEIKPPDDVVLFSGNKFARVMIGTVPYLIPAFAIDES